MKKIVAVVFAGALVAGGFALPAVAAPVDPPGPVTVPTDLRRPPVDPRVPRDPRLPLQTPSAPPSGTPSGAPTPGTGDTPTPGTSATPEVTPTPTPTATPKPAKFYFSHGCNTVTFTNKTGALVKVAWGAPSASDPTGVEVPAGATRTVVLKWGEKHFTYVAKNDKGDVVGVLEHPGVDLTAKCGSPAKEDTGGMSHTGV